MMLQELFCPKSQIPLSEKNLGFPTQRHLGPLPTQTRHHSRHHHDHPSPPLVWTAAKDGNDSNDRRWIWQRYEITAKLTLPGSLFLQAGDTSVRKTVWSSRVLRRWRGDIWLNQTARVGAWKLVQEIGEVGERKNGCQDKIGRKKRSPDEE